MSPWLFTFFVDGVDALNARVLKVIHSLKEGGDDDGGSRIPMVKQRPVLYG